MYQAEYFYQHLQRLWGDVGIEVMTVKDEKDKRCILAIVILALVRLVLYLANGSICGFTFYQPKEPDLHELLERRDLK